MSARFFHTRRFFPLFATQFLGAFNDNFLKNALLVLITYKLAFSQENAGVLVNLAAGLFILPFFLFSATSGQLADKYDRATLTRIIKTVEIVLMVLACLGLWTRNLTLLFFLLFMMGTHSTFFGPIKYALLPQHLREDELVAGNAYIEAGTYLAILTGTILGGVLIPLRGGELMVGGGLTAFAVLGYLFSRRIPPAQAPVPNLKINFNFWKETLIILKDIKSQPVIFRCVLGISWFWLIGALLLAQLPGFCKDVLGASESVLTFFLTTFSIGVGLGSILCARMLKGVIQTTFVPLAALGMSVFIADLYFVGDRMTPGATLLTLSEFARRFDCWRLTFDMLMTAACGGIFIVPLYTLTQRRADPRELARVIAGNNIVNALFMVAAALAVAGALEMGVTIPWVFMITSLINLVVAVYICRLLPAALTRSLLRSLLSAVFRVKVKNLENFDKAGDRVLIIANHTSLLDAALIAAFLPEKAMFAINTRMAERWWVKPWLSLVDAFPMDPTNPLAIRSLIAKIREDRKCVIFPEGRITVTGALMKVYEGSGLIAEKSGAMVLPIRIEGAQYSKFSYMKHKLNTRWFPQITLTVLPPTRFEVDPALKGRARRQRVSDRIHEMMVELIYHTTRIDEHLFHSLLNAAKLHGAGHRVAEDLARRPLSYRRLIAKSYVLGNLMRRYCPREKYIGLMLPTSLPNVVAFWGAQAYDRVPCMINFTAGSKSIVAGCAVVGVKTLFTARQFIELARLAPLEAALKDAGLRIIYLEDVRKNASWPAVLAGMFRSLLRVKPKAAPNAPATVLFTSGSEGAPKAVLLSHRNLQANRAQVLSVMPLNAQDRVFNCLPMFHSFGLSMGTILPILSGIRTFLYPSPLRYRLVPELSYDTMATVIFGTDTFLAAYARVAHPYDFFSVRFALVGAEKLKEATAELWMRKFGVRLLEGYGATECSPVISVNTPTRFKTGSVGRALPGLMARLEPVPGVEKGGRLYLKGDNVTLGYASPDHPGAVQPPPDGWHDSGDIVEIDNEGYIFIKGRAKRFAKIAGEMVSLTAVEEAICKLWPNAINAVVAIPDPRKGEQLVLITNNLKADLPSLVQRFHAQGLSELWAPKRLIMEKNPPLLGTGKFDYVAGKALAEEKNKP